MKTLAPAQRRHAFLAALLLLGGCSAGYNPIDWWHEVEGGRISDSRPPPPNVDAPYPNLSSVPSRPQATDAVARARIAGALVADRANAQYGASQAPLGVPSATRQVTPPPAATSGMSASLEAASAPAAAPSAPAPTEVANTPPRRAPVGRVETAALPAPAEAGPMPSIPPGPPAPPSIAGVPATVAPTPPPATPVVAPVVLPATPGVPVALPFAPASAALTPETQAALRGLAQRRAGAAIAVTGFGEAKGSEAAAQIAAMPLAWLRAQAISGALQSAGVPVSALRITAEAGGQGGVARIVN